AGASKARLLCAKLRGQDARAQLLDCAFRQIAELERAERDADEPVHLQPQMAEHVLDLAVLALAHREGEPNIGTLLAFELRLDRAVANAADRDAVTQRIQRFPANAAECAYAVAAKPAVRRQFERSRQAAVVGQEQQPLRIGVEPADADQPWQVLWQRAEHGRSSLRVGMRGHEASWLVVKKQPRALAPRQRRAVDGNMVRACNTKRGGSNHLPIYGDTPCSNPGFRLAARTQACTRDRLGDPFAGALRDLDGLARHLLADKVAA